MPHFIPNILTIAGSDSSGGAGIQADLKVFSALGTYGASVVTAVTAQNTRGVQRVHVIPADMVRAQLEAVFDDIHFDAVKIGMLGSAANVVAVASVLQRYQPRVIVLDTVMVASRGGALLEPQAVEALRDLLLPLATLVTPNLPEAAVLVHGDEAQDDEAMVAQAHLLCGMGAQAVLLKGGHLAGNVCTDWLVDARGASKLGAARVPTTSTHGTGCSLSAAIAALRPQRLDLASAVSEAKSYVTQALLRADKLRVGGTATAPHSPASGDGTGTIPASDTVPTSNGPLHHFHPWW